MRGIRKFAVTAVTLGAMIVGGLAVGSTADPGHVPAGTTRADTHWGEPEPAAPADTHW